MSLWKLEKHKQASNFSSALELGDGYMEILHTILFLWTFEMLHKTALKKIVNAIYLINLFSRQIFVK